MKWKVMRARDISYVEASIMINIAIRPGPRSALLKTDKKEKWIQRLALEALKQGLSDGRFGVNDLVVDFPKEDANYGLDDEVWIDFEIVKADDEFEIQGWKEEDEDDEV